MVDLPKQYDPTLEAMDEAIARSLDNEERRPYLGMSSIGRPCAREQWYYFRWVKVVKFTAKEIKRFEDGHMQEALAIVRFNAIPGVTLVNCDPETGEQKEFSDFGGHFKGHSDGDINGIYQAPKTEHLWEHKSVDKTKFKKVDALKKTLGEKNALKEWDYTYYAQHVLYMDYGSWKRGYLTVSTPGGREYDSFRTNADLVTAQKLKARAKDIIFRETPPPQIGEAEHFECVPCDYLDICHKARQPDANCRTCLHVTPEIDGTWSCARHKKQNLSQKRQEAGCSKHLYLPGLINAEQIDANAEENWVLYRLPDGSEWRNG